MPANKKYLSPPLKRFVKVSGSIIGGYWVANCLLLLSLMVFPKPEALAVMKFLSYLIWCCLIVVGLLFEKAWKVWLYFGLSGLVLLIPYLLHL